MFPGISIKRFEVFVSLETECIHNSNMYILHVYKYSAVEKNLKLKHFFLNEF